MEYIRGDCHAGNLIEVWNTTTEKPRECEDDELSYGRLQEFVPKNTSQACWMEQVSGHEDEVVYVSTNEDLNKYLLCARKVRIRSHPSFYQIPFLICQSNRALT